MELKDFTTEELRAEIKRRTALEKEKEKKRREMLWYVGTASIVLKILVGLNYFNVMQEHRVKHFLSIML